MPHRPSSMWSANEWTAVLARDFLADTKRPFFETSVPRDVVPRFQTHLGHQLAGLVFTCRDETPAVNLLTLMFEKRDVYNDLSRCPFSVLRQDTRHVQGVYFRQRKKTPDPHRLLAVTGLDGVMDLLVEPTDVLISDYRRVQDLADQLQRDWRSDHSQDARDRLRNWVDGDYVRGEVHRQLQLAVHDVPTTNPAVLRFVQQRIAQMVTQLDVTELCVVIGCLSDGCYAMLAAISGLTELAFRQRVGRLRECFHKYLVLLRDG